MQIYKITNKINEKIYIGLTTVGINKRKISYKCNAKAKRKNGQWIIAAMIKYNFENFEFEVIDTAKNKSELRKKEKFYIKQFDSANPKIGYNIDLGGFCPSKKTLKKMSESHKGKAAWNKGRKGGTSWNKGKPHSEETKTKLSESKKGQIAWNKGLKLTDEHRKNLSNSHKGISSKQRKRILASNGLTYESISYAAKILKLSHSNISAVLHDRLKSTGGYTFKYAEKQNGT